MENLTPRWTQSEPFFFPLSPSCAPVIGTEYQYVAFKPLSYCFGETRFDVKALLTRRPVSRLIKQGDITKEC